jgi:hypothetical protein
MPDVVGTWTMSLGHCWHVVAQLPLVQSESLLHVAPVTHPGQGPPQSMSLSSWFFTRSVQRGAWQMRVAQTLLAQSLAKRQLAPSAHGEHDPPQSLLVSVPF